MLTSIFAFIGTDIDDILVLTLLFSAVPLRRSRISLSAGYISGVTIVTALSMLAAGGLRLFPEQYLRLLGIIPIALGIRAWHKQDDDNPSPLRPSFTGAMLITLGSSADNLGVYIPLFARSAPQAAALSAVVFLSMAALWSLLAACIASLPALRRFIERRASILVPALFILLGLYILLL